MERELLAPALVPVAYFAAAWWSQRPCLIGQRPTPVSAAAQSVLLLFIDYFLGARRSSAAAKTRASPRPPDLHLAGACASAGLPSRQVTWRRRLALHLRRRPRRARWPLARATGHSRRPGFLDSVTDRCASCSCSRLRLVPARHAGCSLMLAAGGSPAEVATRGARRGAGIALDGGAMQRAERIAVSIGTLITACSTLRATPGVRHPVIGVALPSSGSARARPR